MAEKRDQAEQAAQGAANHGGTAHAGHGGSSHGSHAAGGHGGSHEEAHEGAPEWLISFADNVMLQMGFFVILFALAMKAPGGGSKGEAAKEGPENTGGPTAEQLDFALAIRQAFNNPVDLNSTDPHDWLLVRRLRMRVMGQSDAQQEGLKGRERDVQSVRRTDIYNAGGFISFEAGATGLTQAGRDAAAELVRQFRGCQTILEVRGHCSAAEAYERDDRGMQLSYDRALVVAREMVAQGFEWRRLRLTACADTDRVTTTTYNEAGHRANQRVEVVQIEAAAPAGP